MKSDTAAISAVTWRKLGGLKTLGFVASVRQIKPWRSQFFSLRRCEARSPW